MAAPALLFQGAEARVFVDEEGACCKQRFPKRYRHAALDAKINKQRIKKEVKALKQAAEVGLNVPRVLGVSELTIRMEFIQGHMLKTMLNREDLSHETKAALGLRFGGEIAKLHSAGLVHGDLTTSNAMIRSSDDAFFLVDFGLAQSTRSVEDFAVDMYVLQRALLSAHPNSEYVFDAVMQGYQGHDPELFQRVAKQFKVVESRGRKKTAFG